MVTSATRFECTRTPRTTRVTRVTLSHAIIDVLLSWPESHREIFTGVHYRGQSIEEAARATAKGVDEALSILDACEHKLRHSLRGFRSLEANG